MIGHNQGRARVPKKYLKVPEEGETTPAGYKEVPYHNIFDKFAQDKLLKETEMSHKHMRLIHKSLELIQEEYIMYLDHYLRLRGDIPPFPRFLRFMNMIHKD